MDLTHSAVVKQNKINKRPTPRRRSPNLQHPIRQPIMPIPHPSPIQLDLPTEMIFLRAAGGWDVDVEHYVQFVGCAVAWFSGEAHVDLDDGLGFRLRVDVEVLFFFLL